MTEIGIKEAQRDFSRLLDLVEAGEDVVITRHRKPVAKLIRVAPPAARRVPGTWKGAIEIADDFDDDLPGA